MFTELPKNVPYQTSREESTIFTILANQNSSETEKSIIETTKLESKYMVDDVNKRLMKASSVSTLAPIAGPPISWKSYSKTISIVDKESENPRSKSNEMFP